MGKTTKMVCSIKAQAESDDVVDLLIYDVIGESWDGGVTAKSVAEELKKHPNAKTITVSLNSAGGQVFDALAIYNTLSRHPANVVMSIDGAALSSASLIAMAGDTIRMAENAMMMIHDPWALVMGSADDIRKQAEQLDKAKDTLVTTYSARTNQTTEDVSRMMAEETWFTAVEAVAAGFADEVTEAKRMAAMVDLSQFRNAPRWAGQLTNPCPQEVHDMPEEEKKEDETKAEEEEEKKEEEAKAQEEEEEEKKEEPTAASVADFRAALPDDVSPEFLLSCVEGKLTVAQAKTMWASTPKSAATKAPGGSGIPDGGKPTKGGTAAGGDFIAEAKAYAEEHGCKLRTAMSKLAGENPEAHAAWVDSQKAVKI